MGVYIPCRSEPFLLDCVFFDVWPKGSDVNINLSKNVSLTEEELKKTQNEFDLFFFENCDDGPWRFIIGGMLGVDLCGDEPISEGVLSISLEDLCHSSDIISIHADLRADNFSLLDSSKLSLLSSNAYLINTARGELVDEEVLKESGMAD